MQKSLYQSLTLAAVLFVLLGGIYPFLTLIAGQSFFAFQANGSLIYIDNKPVGSKLIGQNFTLAKYFHGRPSSAGNGYDASNSSASNLAATNEALFDKINSFISQILKENPGIKKEDIPIDLITSSASGLDPDISIDSAYLQIPRIAKFRNIIENQLKSLVDENAKPLAFGFTGEKTINVLSLNLALDAIAQ